MNVIFLDTLLRSICNTFCSSLLSIHANEHYRRSWKKSNKIAWNCPPRGKPSTFVLRGNMGIVKHCAFNSHVGLYHAKTIHGEGLISWRICLPLAIWDGLYAHGKFTMLPTTKRRHLPAKNPRCLQLISRLVRNICLTFTHSPKFAI